MKMSEDTIKIRNKILELNVPDEVKNFMGTVFNLGYDLQTAPDDFTRDALKIALNGFIVESGQPELVSEFSNIGIVCGMNDMKR